LLNSQKPMALLKKLRDSALALSLATALGCGNLDGLERKFMEFEEQFENDKRCYSKPKITSYGGISIYGSSDVDDPIVKAVFDVASIQPKEVLSETERIVILEDEEEMGGEWTGWPAGYYLNANDCILVRKNSYMPVRDNLFGNDFFYLKIEDASDWWRVISHEFKHGRTKAVGDAFIDEWVKTAGGWDFYGEKKQRPRNFYPTDGFLTGYSQYGPDEDISDYAAFLEKLYLSGTDLTNFIDYKELRSDSRYIDKVNLLIKYKFIKDYIVAKAVLPEIKRIESLK